MRKSNHIILLCLIALLSTRAMAALTYPELIRKSFAGAQILENRLELKIPEIAENGAVVPFAIGKVNLPTPNAYVTEISLYTEYNLDKPVFVYRFGESSVPEGFKTRIKLSKTTVIIVFARLSNGQVLVARKQVKVTIGGCGGSGMATGSYSSGSIARSSVVSGARRPAGSSSEKSFRASSRGGYKAGILTAGDIDDNLNFASFHRYLKRVSSRYSQTDVPAVHLLDRVNIRVKDVYGQGVSNASIEITPEQTDYPTVNASAGSDGVFRFFPSLAGGAQSDRYTVTVKPPKRDARAYKVMLDLNKLSFDGNFDITLHDDTAVLPDALDLMLVIDTTGSMADELNYLTREFRSIVGAIRARYPSVDMRFSVIVYRDHGDDYVVRNFNFTSSLDEMQSQLARQHAAGGGDMPEAMDVALQTAVGSNWRKGNVARVMFLVADAPPHTENMSEALNMSKEAKRKGIHIYPLAASGVDDKAEYLMRISAAITQGRYLFLTDDSGVGNSHAEPKVACYLTTRLDHLMIRVVGSELSGKRIEPESDQVVRSVGRYDNGVCSA